MRILMLGWEFPPFISGGLGTACFGLTRALDRLGHEITFVLPRAVDRSHASHIRLLSPDGPLPSAAAPEGGAAAGDPEIAPFEIEGFGSAKFYAAASGLKSVYTGLETVAGAALAPPDASGDPAAAIAREVAALREAGVPVEEAERLATGGAAGHYAGDVVAESARYARIALRLARARGFDVIHAHDWMTFPAGLAIARATGRPLVVHVHSTEFDRSGEHVNQRIYDIERRGCHGAVRVIAVSQLTKSILTHRYSVDPEHIDVVYNGVEAGAPEPPPGAGIRSKDRIVLFLGRITMQKGPEYFIAAAKRVLEKVENVKFVVAGAGDMARRMIELAAQMGIGHKVLFTGFLRGDDVKRIFQMADCYVMPSVSEPFGIAPLEAISQDTPVIISRQSGVSEVLTHALKVDFWDVDQIADKIVAVLRHPPLSQTLREHGAFEIRKLTWDGAAQKTVQSYERAIAQMSALLPA